MNVIAANISAKVFEPTYDEATRKVNGFYSRPLIGWLVDEVYRPHPMTAMGIPLGPYMVKFSYEHDSFGFVEIPQLLETMSPWVKNRDGDGESCIGVSSARIIEKFQLMADSKRA